MAELRSGRLRIGVLISGRGSNLQALIDACARPDYPAEIALVIANRADAFGIERARQAGVTATVIPHRNFADRESFDAALDETLRRAGVELVCTAGFMRILTARFIERWRDRQINIHPSLLPLFPGLHTHERALAAGVRFSGCTGSIPGRSSPRRRSRCCLTTMPTVLRRASSPPSTGSSPSPSGSSPRGGRASSPIRTAASGS